MGVAQPYVDRDEKEGDTEPVTIKVAALAFRKILKHELPPDKKPLFGTLVHYGFGSSLGGIFGGLVHRFGAIYGNSKRRNLDCQSACQHSYSTLGRAVGRKPWKGQYLMHRADVNNFTRWSGFEQMPQNSCDTKYVPLSFTPSTLS